MRQIILDLQDENDRPPRLLELDRELQLIVLMVQCLLAVIQHHGEENHESE